MSNLTPSGHGRFALKLFAAGALASLMAGCASDATRLSDPFSNPFATSSNEPVRHVASAETIPAGRSPPIVSQALAPRNGPMASAAPLRPQVMTAYNAPISRETTGSIAPMAVSTAPHASVGGWTSGGGVPIIVAEGESADVLSKRYGVPANALLETNGLRSASDIHPGTHLTVPIYNVVGSASRATAQVAQAEPVRAVPKPQPAHMVQAAPGRGEPPHPLGQMASLNPKPARNQAPVRAVASAHQAPPAKPSRIEVQPRKQDLAHAERPAKTAVPIVAQPVAPTKSASVKTASLTPAAAPIKAVPAPATKQPDPTPTASVPASAPVADAAGNPEFRWPARGRIIQGFKGGNDGINIAVPEGTAVKAAETGTVAYAGSELKGYGNLVLIRHPNGFVTAYANNGELDVKRGDQVKRGQVIAKSGQSGNVASPQLHFELRKGSTPVDPTSYLAGL